jgi:hypothetical protein
MPHYLILICPFLEVLASFADISDDNAILIFQVIPYNYFRRKSDSMDLIATYTLFDDLDSLYITRQDVNFHLSAEFFIGVYNCFALVQVLYKSCTKVYNALFHFRSSMVIATGQL